jgi:hypothetical protein
MINCKQCCGSFTFCGWIRIRILGSMPLTKDPDPDTHADPQSRITEFVTNFWVHSSAKSEFGLQDSSTIQKSE